MKVRLLEPIDAPAYQRLRPLALYQSLGFASHGVEPDAVQVDGMFHGEERYTLRWDAVV